MLKRKVGDTVVILNPLPVFIDHGGFEVDRGMMRYQGITTEIVDIVRIHEDIPPAYRLKADDERLLWVDSMLEIGGHKNENG
jgi:hypothetical protein